MNKFSALAFCAVLIVIEGCKTVPITGRRQMAFIPSSQINSLSFSTYGDMMRNAPLSTNQPWTAMVKNSGDKIKTAVEKYLADKGQSDATKGFEWEFNLIANPTVNAFCMPGGKVAFYEGIMPVCQNELGVAVVMGHEIAHAIANHGNERMTQGLAQQFGGAALSVALRDKPQQTQALFMTAYGVGSQYAAILPFSRLHESEADELGLVFMAMAGYDPREAPKFWERMSSASGGAAPPEFMSTHPSHNTRIKNLNAKMPEAIKIYEANRK
ncbi:MAG: M48 family metallopeptidase [Schleiferiaceae bacterium]|nr:M48 family metallopeptidase [Schleiferiaceae bacterium]